MVCVSEKPRLRNCEAEEQARRRKKRGGREHETQNGREERETEVRGRGREERQTPGEKGPQPVTLHPRASPWVWSEFLKRCRMNKS